MKSQHFFVLILIALAITLGFGLAFHNRELRSITLRGTGMDSGNHVTFKVVCPPALQYGPMALNESEKSSIQATLDKHANLVEQGSVRLTVADTTPFDRYSTSDDTPRIAHMVEMELKSGVRIVSDSGATDRTELVKELVHTIDASVASYRSTMTRGGQAPLESPHASSQPVIFFADS